MNVTFHNFKGEVKYTDATTAPTFSLTAPGGLVAEGQLGLVVFPSGLTVESQASPEIHFVKSVMQPKLSVQKLMRQLTLHKH